MSSLCYITTSNGGTYEVEIEQNGNVPLPAGVSPEDVVGFYCEDTDSEVLDCRKFTNIESIIVPMQIRELNCSQCTKLTELDTGTEIEFIDCSGCTSLTELSSTDSEELYRVDCHGCCNLEELNLSSSVVSINCDDCVSLERIKLEGKSHIRELSCVNCPRLKLPKGLLRRAKVKQYTPVG